mgnify:CR=1 FL=1
MAGFSARGTSGELRVGYKVVSTFTRWTMQDDRVEAHGSPVDGYWRDSGQPFSIHLKVGRSVWIWRMVDVTHGSPMVIAVVGSPEVQHTVMA